MDTFDTWRLGWLACWTQEEIAESEGVAKGPVSEICSEFATLEKTNKSAATLATYAEPCGYTTPKQQRSAQE